MTTWTTGAAILAHAGAAPGSPLDVAWSDECAAAVNEGLDVRLAGAWPAEPVPLPAELTRAALTAGTVAYKSREANLDADAPKVVGDYLDTIEPIIGRYATTGIA